jgi:hypothetical protein
MDLKNIIINLANEDKILGNPVLWAAKKAKATPINIPRVVPTAAITNVSNPRAKILWLALKSAGHSFPRNIPILEKPRASSPKDKPRKDQDQRTRTKKLLNTNPTASFPG